jgi:hypothetical protein
MVSTLIGLRALLLFGFAGLLSAADPFTGVWKLSRAKSSGSLPSDEIVTIREIGRTLAVEVKVVNGPNQENLVIRYTSPTGGGAGHMESGPFDAVTVKRPNLSTLDITYFAKGVEMRSTRVEVAKDRRTMNSVGKVRVGEEAWNIVFEKQTVPGVGSARH